MDNGDIDNKDNKKINIYGSLLRDYPEVDQKANIYPITLFDKNDEKIVKKIPKDFDGRDVWALYIQSPSNQHHTTSWAIVAKDVLNDRFTLGSGGQITFSLNYFEILTCIKDKPLKKREDVVSSLGVTDNVSISGYSIYNAWEYLYTNGLSQSNCFSRKKFIKYLKFSLPEEITYDEKIKMYGDSCVNIEGNEQTSCLSKVNGIPVARHIFFSNAIFNITTKSMSMEDKILKIKYEIAKWGPVAAGFIIYENFRDKYNGLTVYDKVEGNPLGGHYVSVVGWKDDYWICRNSWGTEWGLLGYFKIKMGIPEIMFEDNISAISPYIQQFDKTPDLYKGSLNGNIINMTDMNKINPILYEKRSKLDVDYNLFYTQKTIDLIKQGKLYGSLEPFIRYPELLPDQIKFWYKNISNYNYITLSQSYKPPENKSFYYIFIVVIICLGALAFYLGYRTKK